MILSWTAVPGATNHRIGWLADEYYQVYLANDVWRQKFAYSDVVAAETYTVARLTPGIKYWLIVGDQSGLAWSAWKDLVLNSDTMACPADAGAGTPTPTATPAGVEAFTLDAHFEWCFRFSADCGRSAAAWPGSVAHGLCALGTDLLERLHPKSSAVSSRCSNGS